MRASWHFCELVFMLEIAGGMMRIVWTALMVMQLVVTTSFLGCEQTARAAFATAVDHETEQKPRNVTINKTDA
jgi:hypothetical protein